MDRCWVYAIVHNEEAMLPYWARHYGAFAEHLVIYDDASEDRTRELARALGVEVREYPGSGLDDELFVSLANSTYPEARGYARWVIWTDIDEFVFDPNMAARLDHFSDTGVTLPTVEGYGMYADAPPTTHGQIWQELRMGVRMDRYDKRIVVDPSIIIAWTAGRHETNGRHTQAQTDAPLKLLHYRWLGEDYHRARNAKNAERISETNMRLSHGVEVFPGARGPYSLEWYREQRQYAEDVIGTWSRTLGREPATRPVIPMAEAVAELTR
jgi:hypothetical protein